MPMVLLSNRFLGLDNRREPTEIGPELAADLSNVNLLAGSIQPRNGLGGAVTTPGANIASIYKFNGAWVTSATNYQYAEFGGNLYRAAAGTAPQKSSNGTTFYGLGIAAPGSAPTVATGAAGVLTGTYTYQVTFTNAFGGESAPSAVSGSVAPAAQRVDLSNIPTSADAQVTGRKLYRTNAAGTSSGLVTTIADNVTTTYTDNIADASLGASNASTSYGVPGNLECLAITPEGVALGAIGTRLYFSVQAALDAWPAGNYLDLPYAVKAIVPCEGSVAIFTTGGPFQLVGSNASTFQLVTTRSQDGCVTRDAVVDMGDLGVFYLALKGIARYQGGGTELISEGRLSNAFMASIIAGSGQRAARNGTSFILFHSAGFLEFDPLLGESPWVKGVLPTPQPGPVHFNRTDNALYVCQASGTTSPIKAWEAGSALTFTYKTGDWSAKGQGGGAVGWLRVRRIFVLHSGAVTVQPYMNGVALGGAQTFTNATMARSEFFVPNTMGNYLSLEITGTGRVVEVAAEAAVTGVPFRGQ